MWYWFNDKKTNKQNEESRSRPTCKWSLELSQTCTELQWVNENFQINGEESFGYPCRIDILTLLHEFADTQ